MGGGWLGGMQSGPHCGSTSDPVASPPPAAGRGTGRLRASPPSAPHLQDDTIDRRSMGGRIESSVGPHLHRLALLGLRGHGKQWLGMLSAARPNHLGGAALLGSRGWNSG